MLLSDLSKYASDQKKRIAKLPSTAISPASSIWEELRSSHWGKPLTSFEKEEPLEYDLDPVPSLTPPTNRSILTVAQEQLGGGNFPFPTERSWYDLNTMRLNGRSYLSLPVPRQRCL